MNPIRFRCPPRTIDSAEDALSHYLPGLDVQLFEYRSGTVLMPPHLLLALETDYGPDGARAVLENAGLVRRQEVSWHEVVAWGRLHHDAWTERGGDEALGPDATAGLLWHLRMCHVEVAWRALGGPDRIDWAGVRVGHIDTGYTRHPVFGFPEAPWIDVAGARTFLPGPPPADGTDTLTGGSGGHGTTSGSVCVGLETTAAYYGVAPRAPLVPTRVSDCVIIDEHAAQFEAAARYLVDEARVGVINVSMGTFLKSTAPEPIARALDHCYDNGVILVAAAGNVPAPDWPAYPAALPRAIAVAGVTVEARPWCGSSYGPWVDLSAPAKDIRHAVTAKGPVYGTKTTRGGTTFAAAMTSGAAALWLAAHGERIGQRYPLPWQRIEAFRLMARRTATVPPHWVADRGFGAGILDVGALMNEAALPDTSELVAR